MGYSKLVISGRMVETFEYSMDLPVQVKREKKKRVNSAIRAKINAKVSFSRFNRIMRANFNGDSVGFLTLTFRDNVSDLGYGWRCFTLFIKKLRYKYGKGFRYVCVPEYQKRGAIHFHVVLWGFPLSVIRYERRRRVLAGIWSYGFVDAKETDGNDKICSYISKYLRKGVQNGRFYNERKYIFSRNTLKPVIIPLASAIDCLSTIVGKTRVAYSKEFDTQYMGRCIYKNMLVM